MIVALLPRQMSDRDARSDADGAPLGKSAVTRLASCTPLAGLRMAVRRQRWAQPGMDIDADMGKPRGHGSGPLRLVGRVGTV